MMTLVMSAAVALATNNVTETKNAPEADINVELTVQGNTFITVNIDKVPGERMRVLLKSGEGEFLYTKSVKKYGWAEITFDTGNLPGGEYEVEVFAKGKKIYEQGVEKSSDELSLITQ